MKRLISIILAIAVIGAIPTFALATGPGEISTYDELVAAMEQAADGDTLTITQTIYIGQSGSLGDSGKKITLHGADGVSPLLCFNALDQWEGDYAITNVVIDGEGKSTGSRIEIDTPNTVRFSEADFRNCTGTGMGGALKIVRGSVSLQGCSFQGCSGNVGGAVYVQYEGTCSINGCTFSGNTSAASGGAVSAIGATTIADCVFSENICAESGGAVYGDSIAAERSSYISNQAQNGGAIFGNTSVLLDRCKVYGNTATTAGADISTGGTITIVEPDYEILYSEELAAGEYDFYGWFPDTIDQRYTQDRPTEQITSFAEPLETRGLKFVLLPAPTPEPEPEPDPEPDPTPSTRVEYVPIYITTEPEKKPAESPQTAKTPARMVLKNDKATLDSAAVEPLLEALRRYVPAGEKMTRGKAVALLYGLLTAESKANCVASSAITFSDLQTSPYKDAVYSLAAAGVVSGGSDGLFRPGRYLTYGELLTMLTSLVAPKNAYVGSFADHWAAKAAETACAYGWIDDVPINLDAPTTYGAFVNLMTKVYGL